MAVELFATGWKHRVRAPDEFGKGKRGEHAPFKGHQCTATTQ
jgi:hypothetical protein